MLRCKIDAAVMLKLLISRRASYSRITIVFKHQLNAIAVFYELSNRATTTSRFIASLPSTNPTTSLSSFCLPFYLVSSLLALLSYLLYSVCLLLLFLGVSTSVAPCFSAIQPSRSCYHD